MVEKEVIERLSKEVAFLKQEVESAYQALKECSELLLLSEEARKALSDQVDFLQKKLEKAHEDLEKYSNDSRYDAKKISEEVGLLLIQIQSLAGLLEQRGVESEDLKEGVEIAFAADAVIENSEIKNSDELLLKPEERKIVKYPHYSKFIKEAFTAKNSIFSKGTDLFMANFRGCAFKEISFAGTGLKNSTFAGCVFEGVNFSKENLADIRHFNNCEFKDCLFPKGVNLSGDKFKSVKLIVGTKEQKGEIISQYQSDNFSGIMKSLQTIRIDCSKAEFVVTIQEEVPSGTISPGSFSKIKVSGNNKFA